MRQRRKELIEFLQPAAAGQIEPLISSLFVAFPARAETGVFQDASIMLFAADLLDLPFWAADYAIGAFRRGDAGNGRFCPTQAEVRRFALGYTRPYADELNTIDKILDAQPGQATDPERANVADGFKELLSDLVKNLDPYARPKPRKPMSEITMAEAELALERLKGEPVPGLSPAALAALAARKVQP